MSKIMVSIQQGGEGVTEKWSKRINEDFKQVSLHEVIDGVSVKKSKMVAQILHIKKFKRSAVVTKNYGKEKKERSLVFSRMVYFSSEGRMGVLIIREEDDLCVMHFSNSLTIGGYCLIIEPISNHEMLFGVDIIQTKTALWTMSGTMEPLIQNIPSSSLMEAAPLTRFSMKIKSMSDVEITFAKSCSRKLCDGRFGTNCCCISGRNKTVGNATVLTFKCDQFPENVTVAPFSSMALGLKFVPSLVVSYPAPIWARLDDVALHIEDSLEEHKDSFVIDGWFKSGTKEGDTTMAEFKVHISRFEVLGSQPKFPEHDEVASKRPRLENEEAAEIPAIDQTSNSNVPDRENEIVSPSSENL